MFYSLPSPQCDIEAGLGSRLSIKKSNIKTERQNKFFLLECLSNLVTVTITAFKKIYFKATIYNGPLAIVQKLSKTTLFYKGSCSQGFFQWSITMVR